MFENVDFKPVLQRKWNQGLATALFRQRSTFLDCVVEVGERRVPLLTGLSQVRILLGELSITERVLKYRVVYS